jgi:hypothetical protein
MPVSHPSALPHPHPQPVARKRLDELRVEAPEEERMMLELSPDAGVLGIFQGEHGFVVDEHHAMRMPVETAEVQSKAHKY